MSGMLVNQIHSAFSQMKGVTLYFPGDWHGLLKMLLIKDYLTELLHTKSTEHMIDESQVKRCKKMSWIKVFVFCRLKKMIACWLVLNVHLCICYNRNKHDQ